LIQKYFEFGRAFEKQFVNQSFSENRSIEETLTIAWRILSILPKTELTRINESDIEKYYGTA